MTSTAGFEKQPSPIPDPEEGKVRSRDQLRYLLCEAAELEHLLCCSYLFAGYSLKRDVEDLGGKDDPIAWKRWNAINDWTQTIFLVARQEMEHLALANNLLTAIGGAPHFDRPNFPQPAKYFPKPMTLEAFSKDTIERFICFERPEDGTIPDFCREHESGGASLQVAPQPITITSPGALYGMIRQGFQDLSASGADLFVGPAAAQLTGAPLFLNFPRYGDTGGVYDIWLFPVTDLASAERAIDLIIEQGEGAPEAGEESHYERFRKVREAFLEMRKEDFEPALDVVPNPMLWHDMETPEGTKITHPDTRLVMDLFNGVYETLLLLLIRYCAQTNETPEDLKALTYAVFFPMMTMVIRPLAEHLTTMPAYHEDDKRRKKDGPQRAGPSFEFYTSIQFLPHRDAAWTVLTERMEQLSRVCRCLTEGTKCKEMERAPTRKIEELGYIAESLELTTRQFSALLQQ